MRHYYAIANRYCVEFSILGDLFVDKDDVNTPPLRMSFIPRKVSKLYLAVASMFFSLNHDERDLRTLHSMARAQALNEPEENESEPR